MKHKIEVTPMNCAFGAGMNTLMTFDESEYRNAPQRSIYCKDPDVSWFKMKSINATPYTEPAFYGLGKGDLVTVEFEALLLSGVGSITFDFVKINPDYTTLNLVGKSIPNDSLTGFYKKFKMSQFIEHDGIGTIVNLRPSGSNNEVIIKNITIEIKTTNPLFSVSNNVVGFRTKTDFMKCIDFYAGTNINTTYNGLLTLYKEGKLSFPDDNTLKFTDAGITLFKGLMSMFNGHKYRPTVAIYAEYISPVQISATIKNVKEDGTFTQEGVANIPTSTAIAKKMIYVTGSAGPSRKTFVDLGFVSSGSDLTLKNVRLAMPQFDDSIKRAPNQLDELYTNLSAKLR